MKSAHFITFHLINDCSRGWSDHYCKKYYWAFYTIRTNTLNTSVVWIGTCCWNMKWFKIVNESPVNQVLLLYYRTNMFSNYTLCQNRAQHESCYLFNFSNSNLSLERCRNYVDCELVTSCHACNIFELIIYGKYFGYCIKHYYVQLIV